MEVKVDVSISFVVCTYNPDYKRLTRVLECLSAQEVTGSEKSVVEIVIVDNRSCQPIGEVITGEFGFDLKIVREDTPGLTAARITGAAEARGDLIVFVDDDNLLDSTYAKEAIRLAVMHPQVGVFSSGSILPEYKGTPPKDIKMYWPYMALIESAEDIWSNIPGSGVLPMGAGMVVRSKVMDEYAVQLSADSIRLQTDRDGQTLFAGGDTDIGLTACAMGLGCGIFPSLQLIHEIPSDRLNTDYLHRLVRDVAYSTNMVACRAGVWPVGWRSVVKKFLVALMEFVTPFRSDAKVRRISSWSRFRAFRDFRLGRWLSKE